MKLLFLVVLALAAVPLAIAAGISRAIHRREKRTYLDAYFVTPWEVGVPFEEVRFRSADGVALRGWGFARPGRRVIVGCSGLNGSTVGPYRHRALSVTARVSVYFFSNSGDRGESGCLAPAVSGYFEWRISRPQLGTRGSAFPGARIGLLGFLHVGPPWRSSPRASRASRPWVADSSYSSLGELIAERLRRYRLPSRFLLWCAGGSSACGTAYSLDALAPSDAVRRPGFPPAPLHTTAGPTRSIPAEHSVLLHRASGGNGELWLAECAEHCGAYFQTGNATCARVAALFQTAPR
jgi:hypothetical protein